MSNSHAALPRQVTCAAHTSSGKPCKMRPLRGSTLCWNHSPESAEGRAAARSKGGRNGRRRIASPLAGHLRIASPTDLVALIELAINDTLALDNSVSRNKALAQLAVASLRVWEAVEVEARLRALEALPTRLAPRAKDKVAS